MSDFSWALWWGRLLLLRPNARRQFWLVWCFTGDFFADFCAAGRFRRFPPPPPELRDLRRSDRRDDVVWRLTGRKPPNSGSGKRDVWRWAKLLLLAGGRLKTVWGGLGRSTGTDPRSPHFNRWLVLTFFYFDIMQLKSEYSPFPIFYFIVHQLVAQHTKIFNCKKEKVFR